MPVGPPPRPESLGVAGDDFRRGRSLALNASNGRGVALGVEPRDGSGSQKPAPRRCTLQHETEGHDQALEFYPQACHPSRDGSAERGRVDVLEREKVAANEVPEWTFGVRSSSRASSRGSADDHKRRSVLASEERGPARSVGLPRPPGFDAGGAVPSYGRRALVGRDQDIGFGPAQLATG